ncbi:MAG TPA: FadR/GntR family transcriptional regulator [Terriglobia bacterium]|jgi:GntR family transcriptional repressor for pyruvate dehydrogenase complex|nr:FadR/GntR family transcriptional regulator [Terriglobia bacterium]
MSVLVPVGRSQTITEAIAGQLIRLIMQGRYKPGDRLPSEFELADQFRAGRGAVREALKALAIVGLVRVDRGKGTFVSEREDYLTHPLSLGLKAETELRRLIEARRLIEVELAGLAAERATPRQIQEIQSLVEAMAKSTGPEERKKFLESDVQFHFAVADAADNFILSQFLTLVRNLMKEWITKSLQVRGVASEAVRQHRQILAAIARRQKKEARRAMERHLTAMGERFLQSEKGQLKPKSGQHSD